MVSEAYTQNALAAALEWARRTSSLPRHSSFWQIVVIDYTDGRTVAYSTAYGAYGPGLPPILLMCEEEPIVLLPEQYICIRRLRRKWK